MSSASLTEIFAKKKACVAYMTAGLGGIDYCYDVAANLFAAGVDILEIGMPHSDPIADGPVITNAMHAVLSEGFSFDALLQLAERIQRNFEQPLVLFTYYNPLYVQLLKGLSKHLPFDGLLTVDTAIECAPELKRLCQQQAIQTVDLITPESSTQRIQEVVNKTTGFLYYVLRHGVTGVDNDTKQTAGAMLRRLKTLTDKPVVAGFGIGNQTQAAAVLDYADGFVVGSKIVSAMLAHNTPKEIGKLIYSIIPRTMSCD